MAPPVQCWSDTATVQSMAGHKSVKQPQHDRHPDVTKRKAAELLHVPYIGHYQSNFLDKVKADEQETE